MSPNNLLNRIDIHLHKNSASLILPNGRNCRVSIYACQFPHPPEVQDVGGNISTAQSLHKAPLTRGCSQMEDVSNCYLVYVDFVKGY